MGAIDIELGLRAGVFLAVFAVLALWEWAAPARVLKTSRRRRWGANLGLALVSLLVVRFLVPASALAVAAIAEDERWGLLNHFSLPGWGAIVLGLLALDLTVYLQHVLFHSVPLLLRLHAVHHADPDFDLTTGIRFHPLEILVSAVIKLGAIAALGAPVIAVLAFELVLNAAAMFSHANVSLPDRLEPLARRILVTPDMHRIHHSVIEAERNSNYGFCLSIWDRLLGTYTALPKKPLDIGLSSWRDPRTTITLPGTLGMPFHRR